MDNKKKLWKLFCATFYLSAFTFGGGYVIVSLMKNKFVDDLHWIEEQEMLEMVAIAQSAPGPIAVNGAIVLGYKLCGMPGVLSAVLGAILPPFFILSIVSGVYQLVRDNWMVAAMLDGMQSGVGAVIASVVYDMAAREVKGKDVITLAIMAITFVANYFFHANVAVIILICIGIGLLRTFLTHRGKGAEE